tara:strand:- start:67 stop:558 length:492 start_codon:yes stop_codon:yes gene_type:complete
MKKILIVLILFIFSFSFIARSEDFPDGKYFAHIRDTQNIIWKIIITKKDNSLIVNYLESGKGKFDYEGAIYFFRKNNITHKVPKINLDDKMRYDLGLTVFFRTMSVHIRGTLGKYSKLSWGHSSYIYDANFKYVPYKYYDSFQEELKNNKKLTTNDFLSKITH